MYECVFDRIASATQLNDIISAARLAFSLPVAMPEPLPLVSVEAIYYITAGSSAAALWPEALTTNYSNLQNVLAAPYNHWMTDAPCRTVACMQSLLICQQSRTGGQLMLCLQSKQNTCTCPHDHGRHTCSRAKTSAKV